MGGCEGPQGAGKPRPALALGGQSHIAAACSNARSAPAQPREAVFPGPPPPACLVVGGGSALHHRHHARKVADQLSTLAADELQGVWVLLLRHQAGACRGEV